MTTKLTDTERERHPLLTLLIEEYGADEETWTAMGSFARVTRYLAARDARVRAAALAPIQALAEEMRSEAWRLQGTSEGVNAPLVDAYADGLRKASERVAALAAAGVDAERGEPS